MAVMTTVGLEPCPVCPAGIRMCAHLGDRVVWLADEHLFEVHEGQPPWDGVRWAAQGPGVPEPCPLGCRHVGLPYAPGTDSLAEAEAEFARRDELLRSEP